MLAQTRSNILTWVHVRVLGKLKKTQEEANIARMEIEEKKEREKKASLDKKELVSALNALLTQSITDSIHY